MFRSSFFILHRRVLLLAVAVGLSACLLGIPKASAVVIDGAEVYITNGEAGGTIGAYSYNAADDTYYVAIFGTSAGLSKIWRASPSDPWQSAQLVTQSSSTASDMLRFYRSSNVAGGAVNSNDTGSPTMSGILVNPAPLTLSVPTPANYQESFGYGPVVDGKISVTYAPGSLAFISDGGGQVKTGSTVHYDWTKKMYRWDLRSLGSTTTVQPDYNTGTSGSASNPNPGGLYGAYGQADWNDVFSVGLTEAALRQAYDDYRVTHPSSPAWPTTTVTNFGRQFAWSSDGQSIYAVDTNSYGGGVYKVSATQGTAKVVYSEPDNANGSNVISEPAVIPTSHRDLGAGFGAGDQILFDGTKAGGNDGGISYVVDNGVSASSQQVLVSGQKFRDYAEITSGGVSSIAADSAGNVYFYETGTHELHKYDTQGHLSVVLNKAQLYEVNETLTSTRGDSGGMLRLQVREDSTGTYVTYRGNNSYIGSIKVYATGDFNHDGTVNQTDKNFFIEQYNKTFHGNAPLTVGVNGATNADYVNYIAADINGSSNPNTGTTAGLSAVSVTYKDLLTLDQFVAHKTGDFNWDGTALNGSDWSIFGSHYNHAPAEFNFANYSWFDGDVTFDGLVNENDYRRLTLPGDLNYDGKVDSADEAILQSYLGQNVLARNAALGDITEDGVVNSADLAILQAHLGQSLVTWNGGGSDNHWSSAANWSVGRTPQYSGDKLVFSGATQSTALNDLPADTALNALIFKFDAGPFTLQGNRISLANDVINQSSNNQTIGLDIRISSDKLTFDTGSAGIRVEGSISESAPRTGLAKIGTGTLTLAQANSISGTVEVLEGNLNLLGSLASASHVDVATGAELILANTSGSSLSATTAIENNGVIQVATSGQTVGSIVGSGSIFVQNNATLTASSIVQSSLTIGGTAQASAVPEPSGFMLLVIAMLAGGTACHKRANGLRRNSMSS
jgi:autotransporter-associated beta strand protein